MPVTLPTAADVRKVREQAAKNAAERAEAARTPLLAVLGAGDAAVTVVTKAVVDTQTRRQGAGRQGAGLRHRAAAEAHRRRGPQDRRRAA